MALLLALLVQAQDPAEPKKADALAPLVARFQAEKQRPAPVRLATLAAIAGLGTDASLDFLEQVVKEDKDGAVRSGALQYLGLSPAERSVKFLAAFAADKTADLMLRRTALDGLTATATKEGFELCRVLIREQSEIRLVAWSAFSRYPLERTEALWRQGLGDTDPLVKGLAFAALAPLKDLKLQEMAKTDLLNPDAMPFVKYGAVAVLKAADGIANARVLLAAAASSDATLRRLLAEALGANTDDKTPDLVYAALRQADANVRSVAARALGKLRDEKASSRLSEPLKDKVPEVRQAALESVAERKDKSSEAVLQREAQRSDEDLAAPAILLLSGFPSEATKALLLKLAGNAKPGIMIPALEALGEMNVPEGLAAFEKALKSKDWPVRVTAARAVARAKSKEAIDLLVDRLDKEEGRMLAELVEVLRGLTGKTFGYAPGQWKEWWTLNREGFDFAKAAADAAAFAAGGSPGATTYHGVPILSTRIIFILDISGSMSSELGKESRMDLAKKELGRTLGVLSSEARINLIFFDDRIEPWRKSLQPLKPNLKEAQAVVAQLKPRGRTNIFDALELAFLHKDVDTIFLLSDGEPTDGRIVEPADILREIARQNRTRKIAIHSISYGPSPFMKLLAEQNGGQYVEIR
jgi:HEAT repeat protein